MIFFKALNKSVNVSIKWFLGFLVTISALNACLSFFFEMPMFSLKNSKSVNRTFITDHLVDDSAVPIWSRHHVVSFFLIILSLCVAYYFLIFFCMIFFVRFKCKPKFEKVLNGSNQIQIQLDNETLETRL